MSWALNKGFSEMADLLASYGGSVYSYYYAQKGDLPVAAAVLKADPSLADEFISTFDEQLPEEKPLAIVRMAFRAGADAKKVSQWTLYRARNWPNVLRELFENGVDPNVQARGGKFILHVMARLGFGEHPFRSVWNADGLDVMLEYGADIHARDDVYKATPLAWAAMNGHADMAGWLMEHGAKPNLPDDEPWATPLFWAERKGHTKVEALLKANGAVA